jgi:hypothetical protein
MAYLLLILLFALPLLLFLKTQGAFGGFTLLKFIKALNRATVVYLFFALGFAFLMAYLETYVYLQAKETPMTDDTMTLGTNFMYILLLGVLPLVVLFAIIRVLFGKKLRPKPIVEIKETQHESDKKEEQKKSGDNY